MTWTCKTTFDGCQTLQAIAIAGECGKCNQYHSYCKWKWLWQWNFATINSKLKLVVPVLLSKLQNKANKCTYLLGVKEKILRRKSYYYISTRKNGPEKKVKTKNVIEDQELEGRDELKIEIGILWLRSRRWWLFKNPSK